LAAFVGKAIAKNSVLTEKNGSCTFWILQN
jgi:hypothetical protein